MDIKKVPCLLLQWSPYNSLQVCDKAKAEGKLEDLMTHLEGKWGKCSIKTELKMGCNIIVAFAPIWILISESIEIIKVIGNSIHSSTLKPKLMEWSEKIDLMETSLDRCGKSKRRRHITQ